MTKDEFITERTNIISEMLDNPDEHGIYPTSKCFNQLDNLFDRIVRETFPCRKAPQEIIVKKSNNTQQPQQAICRWTLDDIDGKWDTDCGDAFCFIDGDPNENGMKFCPYCGKQLAMR